MKKYFGFLVLLVALVLTTGCGNDSKTLVCTNSSDEDGMTMNQIVKVVFENDKASNINLTIDMTIEEQYQNLMSMLEESLKDEYRSLEGEKGVNITTSSKGNVLTLKLDADLKQMSEQAQKELKLIGANNDSYSSTKSSLEESGYKCK